MLRVLSLASVCDAWAPTESPANVGSTVLGFLVHIQQIIGTQTLGSQSLPMNALLCVTLGT